MLIMIDTGAAVSIINPRLLQNFSPSVEKKWRNRLHDSNIIVKTGMVV